MWKMFESKIILITGGTGSFGNAFVRECLTNHNPKKSSCIHVMKKNFIHGTELSDEFPEKRNKVRRLGDVRDPMRLSFALRK